MKSAPFWTVVTLMLAAAVMLQVRGDTDRVPPSRPLTEFPQTVDGLNATDQPIAQEALDVLGKGYFLNRVYTPPNESTASPDVIGFFIGYFPTQRTGQSIHSPQNCLPGAGWSFLHSGVVEVPGVNGAPAHTVGDYLISNGTNQAEVLYWYKTENRWIASDWVAKYYMLLDSMRYSRTDAALVRITTTVRPGEDRADAQRRAVDFASKVSPLLPTYIPD